LVWTEWYILSEDSTTKLQGEKGRQITPIFKHFTSKLHSKLAILAALPVVHIQLLLEMQCEAERCSELITVTFLK
jgi:hypothetical protein